MFTIRGSGFGLYGYLPALIESMDERLILPVRYQARFFARPELQTYAEKITWTATDADALASADGVVVALSPREQIAVVRECLKYSNVSRMILEKPLAPDPKTAIELFETLIASGKKFRIGYNFRYTHWGSQFRGIARNTPAKDSLFLCWNFLAHHFRNNIIVWKRRDEAGGGVLRFYGIHVLALLAEAGYENVCASQTYGTSPSETETWTAQFVGPGLPNMEVSIDSRSLVQRFTMGRKSVTAANSLIVDQENPFSGSETESVCARGLDERIGVIGALCQSLDLSPDSAEYDYYEQTLRIWNASEAITDFRKI